MAVVGAGVASRYHARAIADAAGVRLVAVVRGDPARAREAEAEFGVRCETSYEALLRRPDVEAICLCTPSGQHAAQAIAAARAGRHVLVEKPMALTLADADAMVAAAREAGLRLGVTYQRRTEPAYASLKRALQAGELGHPILGSVSVPYVRPQAYYDSAAWRGTWSLDGGGALMNQGVHLVDLLVWLMGEVEELAARTATLAHAIEVEDCVAATLRFTSGALGSIVATTAAAPGFPHRVEVYGTRGGVQVEGDTIVRWEAEGEQRPPSPAAATAGTVPAGAGATATGISATAHGRLLADFVAAVREGRAPLVPGEEGRRSLAVVLAVYESARTGRAVRPS
jgi:predicted dehydrogenase